MLSSQYFFLKVIRYTESKYFREWTEVPPTTERSRIPPRLTPDLTPSLVFCPKYCPEEQLVCHPFVVTSRIKNCTLDDKHILKTWWCCGNYQCLKFFTIINMHDEDILWCIKKHTLHCFQVVRQFETFLRLQQIFHSINTTLVSHPNILHQLISSFYLLLQVIIYFDEH